MRYKYMTQKQDVKQKRILEQILEVLRESPEPLRESELAKIIGTGRNVIHYHLKKLTESGIVTSKEKRYSLDEKSTVVAAIVKILAEKECSFVELQNLGFDKRHIQSALSLLEGERRIYRKYPEVIMNESRDVRCALTPFAYSELGICPICKTNICPSEDVVTTAFRTLTEELRMVSIHAKCYPDYKFGREFCCEYCGLPISPKLVDRQRIDHHSIIDHFHKVELDMISFLQGLQRVMNSRVSRPDFRTSDIESWVGCNDEIKEYYNHQKRYNVGDIPEWILKSIKSDEEVKARSLELGSKIANLTEITSKIADSKELKEIQELSYLNLSESTFWQIYKHLNLILPPSDLSYLDQAEEFITGIMKYREKLPEEYDIKSRIKEIWSAAQELRQENERTIQTTYEQLLGPSGYLYTHTSPTWAVAQDHNYEWFYDDLIAERPRHWSLLEYNFFYSTALAYRHGGKIYHPYCAEKLGLTNNSYCIKNNNKKLKGGDTNE